MKTAYVVSFVKDTVGQCRLVKAESAEQARAWFAENEPTAEICGASVDQCNLARRGCPVQEVPDGWTPREEKTTATSRIKLHGLKKAIGDYHRANAGGKYSPRYGILMFDKSTGEIWCDEHYDLGHGSYTAYHNPDIINIGRAYLDAHWGECDVPGIGMKTIKAFIAEHYGIA